MWYGRSSKPNNVREGKGSHAPRASSTICHPQGTAADPSRPGLFCPFAHRTNLVRHLKDLTSIIPISIVKPYPRGGDQKFPSWIFPDDDDEYPGATPDHLFHSKYLSEIYFKADPAYKGRYSVPVLWDKKQGTIVNNESAEILRFLPTAFNNIVTPPPPLDSLARDLYPSDLRSVIDIIGSWLQSYLNTGVYKAGLSGDQVAYDKNVIPVFGALNRLEQLVHTNGGPFILGKRLTESDIRVFATAVRFDMVYVQHFKCNLGIIRHDYPVLSTWLRHVYWTVPGFRESTNSKHIKDNVSMKSSNCPCPLVLPFLLPFQIAAPSTYYFPFWLCQTISFKSKYFLSLPLQFKWRFRVRKNHMSANLDAIMTS